MYFDFFQVIYYTTKAGYNYSCQTVVYNDDVNELQVSLYAFICFHKKSSK